MKSRKRFFLATFAVLCVAALAQDVHYDYDRDANFGAYHTYRWSEDKEPGVDQLMDQNIRRAIEEQLSAKGLQKSDQNAQLLVTYHAALDKEKQFTGWGMGPRWSGMGQASSSTIDVGKLVVDLYDPSMKQLVWRGDVAKTLDRKTDPDKNYKNLQKAMAKLFKNYPPKSKH